MSKRSLSPTALPSAKRIQISGNTVPRARQILSFENSLYDELILCIFSYLSWVDLCTTQATSRKWARLAADNELWREQYLKVYGRTRLRGAKGFFARSDGREMKPLPGRAIRTELPKDWKWMFRISSNWRNGRCSVEQFLDPLAHIQTHSVPASNTGEDKFHIILAGALTIMASPKPSHLPRVIITSQSNLHHTFTCYDSPSQDGLVSITAIALDQSPPASGILSLACFLSTGELFVYEFIPTSSSLPPRKKYIYQPSRSVAPIHAFQAVYYHPLLVTMSDDFSLSLFDLSSGNVRLAQTLTSFTSYPPASLVLSSPSSMLFKLVVAYSVPIYPRHWSVGATELIISKASGSSGLGPSITFREDYKSSLTSTISVINTRTIRAFDVPSGFVDQTSLRTMREQWGRKLLNVADTKTDGKWVVIAPGAGLHFNPADARPTISPASSLPSISSSLHSPTGLQLYRLVLPSQSSSVSATPPKLNFVRTLHGHNSPVSSLALADGRCVSMGQNGSIWVWDLEAGTGAEVASADGILAGNVLHPAKGSVSFDERRIVTAHSGKVVVRRFDI